MSNIVDERLRSVVKASYPLDAPLLPGQLLLTLLLHSPYI